MNKYVTAAIFTASLLVIMVLCGCAGEPEATKSIISPQTQSPGVAAGIEPTVRVIATRNFGRELMFDEVLELTPGVSAMEVLKEVAEVETAYSGGFVDSINGVRSGYSGDEKARGDWFIYINGIQSNMGALEYTMQSGDVEHWDFHDWSFRHFIPAAVGAFPEPFLHGWQGKIRPTRIVYSGNLKEAAEEIKNSLINLGVDDVSLMSAEELTAPDREFPNLILLGTVDNELIAELNRNWTKLGYFAHFEDGNLVVLDSKGETVGRYGAGAGIIQATQNPWNPNGTGACENVAWMVAGTDESGVRSAIETLLEYHTRLESAFAVVIADGEIKKIP